MSIHNVCSLWRNKKKIIRIPPYLELSNMFDKPSRRPRFDRVEAHADLGIFYSYII